MTRKSVRSIALPALVGVGAASRLAAVPATLGDLDAVNFARSLHAFDLEAQAPHFPGYPVYVLLARAFAGIGFGEVASLAAPGILLGCAAVAATGRTLRPVVGEAGALAAAAVVAVAPLAVLQGALPNSDGAGFGALVLAVCCAIAASRRTDGAHAAAAIADQARSESPEPQRFPRALAAGVIAGLALGVRPSFLPALAALPLLFAGAARLRWCAGLLLGLLAWLAPLAAAVGPLRFASIATSFLAGHAGTWGGTVVVRPDLLERLGWLGFDLAAAGLGLPWPGAIDPWRIALALLLCTGAVVLVAQRRRPAGQRLVLRAALLVALPYGAWAFAGQNLLKARHVLPLVAAAALVAGVAAAAVAARNARLAPAFAGALALLLVAVALPLALVQGRVESPGMQLVRHVAGTLPPAGASYLTGEEASLFERYAPWYRAARPAGPDELASAAARLAASGIAVYVSSAAPGADRLRPQLEEVASFATSPLVRAHANPLVLYRYRPALAGGGEHP